MDPLAGRADALARLDPTKIYIEHVRSVLGVSNATAIRICETAVRQGVFSRRVEVLCPDDSVAASADAERDLPEAVHCWQDTEAGLKELEYQTRDLKTVTYY